MKSKQIPFRTVGQRTIDSSFLNSSSNPVPKEDSGNKDSAKTSRLSLSDFLRSKLKESREFPGTVKGKSKPFSSLMGPRELSGSVGKESEAKKGEESPGLGSIVEKVVLEQFKPSGCIVKEEGFVASSGLGGDEAGSSSDVAVVEGSRKRKSEGGYESQIPRKHFAVLGGDPKRRQRRRDKIISREDQVPTYNHYRSGGGFWDSNMEGIDNEEVGFSEVWEGVGSTTFGGAVDWH